MEKNLLNHEEESCIKKKKDLNAIYEEADSGGYDKFNYYHFNWRGSVVSLLTLWGREVILLSPFNGRRKWGSERLSQSNSIFIFYTFYTSQISYNEHVLPLFFNPVAFIVYRNNFVITSLSIVNYYFYSSFVCHLN